MTALRWWLVGAVLFSVLGAGQVLVQVTAESPNWTVAVLAVVQAVLGWGMYASQAREHRKRQREEKASER